MPEIFSIDPNDKSRITWDFTRWLDDDETISSQTVTPSTGATVVSPSPARDVTNKMVVAWFTVATNSTATCHIVTSSGREYDKTVTFDSTDR